MKVYKIRLNPGDVSLGVTTDNPNLSPQYRIDCWVAACENTEKEIFALLPVEMQTVIPKIMLYLPDVRPDSHCDRCDGSGYREERQHWIQLKSGKICFKCKGSGVEPSMRPVFFRRRCIDSLRKSPKKAKEWAEKVVNTLDNPYRPVLLDIAELILAGKLPEIFNLPH